MKGWKYWAWKVRDNWWVADSIDEAEEKGVRTTTEDGNIIYLTIDGKMIVDGEVVGENITWIWKMIGTRSDGKVYGNVEYEDFDLWEI